MFECLEAVSARRHRHYAHARGARRAYARRRVLERQAVARVDRQSAGRLEVHRGIRLAARDVFGRNDRVEPRGDAEFFQRE